jgi:hypothetical protein
VQVCNVHTYIRIHVQSLTLHISVNDRGVLHGAGVPLKSTVKDYSCIDLYAEMAYLQLCLVDKTRQTQGLCSCTTSVW